MDEILTSNISRNEIKIYEEKYNKAWDDKKMTDQIQFEYAWCLVRSDNSNDIKRGIVLLNDLCNKHASDRRDYMYFLAVGYARIKDYKKAKEILDLMLKAEPTNQQVSQLKKHIERCLTSEKNETVATFVVGTAIVGVLAGIGMALAKK